MISYDPLFKTLKKKKITTYALIHKYNISRNLIHRLKHNESVTTTTLNDLCRILECDISDITCYIPEDPESAEDSRSTEDSHSTGNSRGTEDSRSMEAPCGTEDSCPDEDG